MRVTISDLSLCREAQVSRLPETGARHVRGVIVAMANPPATGEEIVVRAATTVKGEKTSTSRDLTLDSLAAAYDEAGFGEVSQSARAPDQTCARRRSRA
jgi:hypothetical protein